MEHAENWNAVTAHRIGQRVAYFRKRSGARGITAQALADRCAELGHPLDRAVIAKLEKGLRQSLTAADLLVLARALDVPPVALVVPVDQYEAVEILPGQSVPVYEAMTWFTGERRFPGDDGPADYPDDLAHVRAYREHAQAVAAWATAFQGAAYAASNTEGALREQQTLVAQSMISSAENGIRHARRELERAGLRLPGLPAELSHLDRTGEGA